jgi:hypothetical protein
VVFGGLALILSTIGLYAALVFASGSGRARRSAHGARRLACRAMGLDPIAALRAE